MARRDTSPSRGVRLVRGVLSTLLGAICWGFSGTCVQYLFASTEMSSLTLTMIRELGAGLAFALFLFLRDRQRLHAMLGERATLVRLAIFGSCGLFLNSTMYATTIYHTNAGTATVLQSLCIVVVLAIACVKTPRLPRPLECTALACALAATFLIATHGDASSLKMPLQGLLFGIATACTAAFYTSYPKRLFDQWGSFAVTGLGMLVGGLTGVICCAATQGPTLGLVPVNAFGVLILAIAVLVGTFGAYGLFLHGISIVGPVAGNMLGAAEPVSATVISALWLHTAFSWADWLGLALMVATIALIALEGSRP